MPYQFYKQFPVTGVDEASHRIDGLGTAEVVDSDNEILDYATAKPAISYWSEGAAASTRAAGQELSFGNLRLMHGLTIAGKLVTPPDFRDDKKEVWINTEPVDEKTFYLAKKGFIKSFSLGGDYARRWCNDCGTDIPTDENGKKSNYCPSCEKTTIVRFTPLVGEWSYVDLGCVPIANFSSVKTSTFTLRKADGTVEEVPFNTGSLDSELAKLNKGGTTMETVQPVAAAAPPPVMKSAVGEEMCPHCKQPMTDGKCNCSTKSLASPAAKAVVDVDAIVAAVMEKMAKKDAKTKRVAGEDLTSDAFAHVGDEADTSTWKLPIKFSTDAKSKRHVQNALARFEQTDLPADAKEKAKAKIHAAAHKYGIDVAEEEKKAAAAKAVLVEQLKKTYSAQLSKATGAKLEKSLQNISDMVNVLMTMRWVYQDAMWEAEYEGGTGDPKDAEIAEQVAHNINNLGDLLRDIVDEELPEVTPSASAGKGAANKAETTKGVKKAMEDNLLLKGGARKSLADTMSAVKAAVSSHAEKCMKAHTEHQDAMCEAHKAHCSKMHKMHKAHAAEMHEHLGKLHKILGTEEADADEGDKSGSGEPEPSNPESEGTKDNYDIGKGRKDSFSKAEVSEMIKSAVKEAVENTMSEVAKALSTDDDGEPGMAKGIGDRSRIVGDQRQGGLPIVKTIPTTKDQDNRMVDAALGKNAGGDVDPATIMKAQQGDREAALAFMKGVQSSPNVPNTILEPLAGIRR